MLVMCHGGFKGGREHISNTKVVPLLVPLLVIVVVYTGKKAVVIEVAVAVVMFCVVVAAASCACACAKEGSASGGEAAAEAKVLLLLCFRQLTSLDVMKVVEGVLILPISCFLVEVINTLQLTKPERRRWGKGELDIWCGCRG